MINKKTTKKIVKELAAYFNTIYVHEDGKYCNIDVYIENFIIVNIFINKKDKTSFITIREDNMTKIRAGFGLKCEWKKAIRHFLETVYVPFAKDHNIAAEYKREGYCLI
jgi:hypothetical protein